MKKSLIMVSALCVAAALLLSACGQAKKPEPAPAPESVAEQVSEAAEQVSEAAEEVKEEVSEAAEEVSEAVSEVAEEVTDAAEEAKEEASEVVEEITDAAEEVKEEAADAAEEVTDAAAEVVEEASEVVEEAKEEVSEAAEEVTDAAAEVVEEASEVVEEAKEEVSEVAEEVKEEDSEVAEEVTDKAAEVLEEASEAVEEVKEEVTEVAEEVKEEVSEVAEEDVTAEEKPEDAAEEPAEPAVPMTYDEYANAAIDDEVFVEVYVQNHQSWWEDQITVYAADEDGAYFIYNMACTEEDAEKLVPGTKILVKGYKAEWSGEVEIADATFEFAQDDAEGYIAEAEDVTELLGKEELIDHMNKFVSFKGLTIEPSKDADEKEAPFLYNWDGSGTQGDDLYFNASINGETFTFTVESYLCDKDSDVYKAVEALKAGDVVDLEGFLYWYNGANPHITSVTVK